MGVQDIAENDELIAQHHITIKELIDMFGREATKRGLNYMKNLEQADRNFRENSKDEDMERGYKRAGVRGDVSRAAEEWESSIEKGGLGLDDADEE